MINELLKAAKAVIEVWDAGRGVWDQINALRAAVERAEKRNADFDKWFVKNYEGVFDLAIYESIRTACISATQANLIAAAPEMLDALKLVVDTFENGGWPSATIVIAKAAIAKAEGNDATTE